MGIRPVIAIFVPLLIVVLLTAGNDQLIHWFLIPCILNGTLAVWFIYDILKNNKIYQITSVPHFLFFHVLFLSPLLHVFWAFYYPYPNPPDYRDWLGLAAFFNFMGYIIYIFIVHTVKQRRVIPIRFINFINKNYFKFYYPIIVGLVGAVLLYTYVSSGGISGIIATSASRIGAGPGANPYAGSGILYMIAESFPIIFFVGIAIILRRRNQRKTIGWTPIIIALVVYFVLLMVDGGLKGSRSDVVWGLLWAGMIVNFTIKAINIRKVILFGGFIVLFMSVFYFYKHGGLSALMNVTNSQTRDSVFSKQTGGSTNEENGNSMEFTLLHDFSRADIEALTLYKISSTNYDLSYGRSYLGGLLSIIPKSVSNDRFPTILKERTELLYGKGSYIPNGTFFCPWIFGLQGEAALNFGYVGFILSFAVYGWFIRYLKKAIDGIPPNDIRIYMVPFLINMSIMSYLGDSQLVVFFFVKFGLIPYITILAISQKVKFKKKEMPELSPL